MKIALVARIPPDEAQGVSGPNRVSRELFDCWKSMAQVHVEHVNLKYTEAYFTRLQHLLKCVRRLEREKFDAVIISGNSTQIPFFVLCIKLFTSRQIAYIAHGLVFIEYRGQSVQCLLERITFNLVDKVICISPLQRSLLQKQYPNLLRKVFVVSHGVAPQYLIPEWQKREQTICFVGRASKAKGFDTLCEALLQVDHSITLYIAGSKGDCETALTQLDSNPSIDLHYLGYVNQDRLGLLYKTCSIFILPSIYESFGLVVLEAMGSGCATILSDAVGAGSTLRAGTDFCVFPVGNSGALASTLNRLLTDASEIERIAKSGMQQARARSWMNVATEYIDILAPLS